MSRKHGALAVLALGCALALGTAAHADGPTQVLPACVELIDAPGGDSPAFPDAPPSSRAAGRVLDTLAAVRGSLRTTRYEHATIVRASEGLYLWDCSGMAAWVLRRSAPHALESVGGDRPVARDFYRAIARAPLSRARGGWQRVARLEDARPGDVLSWVKPRDFPSHNTGHVAFVLAPPVKVREGAYAVRIADATSFGHQADTRPEGSGGGYGEGTLLFLVDANGQGRAYGWFGTMSDAVIVTPVVVGRPAS